MSSQVTGSPERRSAADLQRILDSLIGDAGFVLSAHLPDVLAEYERKHDLIILEPSEYAGLKELCNQHGDLELGANELFAFLAAIPKPQPQRSPSPSPRPPFPHSVSLPPSSFKDHDQSTPKQKISRRRNSDRIRSPSDSSSSSSDGDETSSKRLDRQSSAPPGSKAFPSAGFAPSISYANRPLPPKRTKTLSDPSRLDSPLAIRVRGAQGPPSAYGNVGFARPSPASWRTRKSSGNSAGLGGDDSLRSPSYDSTPLPRSMSSTSVSAGGRSASYGTDGDNGRPFSPMSPTDGLDSTSFHERAKSPEEIDELERQMDIASSHGSEIGDMQDETGGEEVDQVDMSVIGLGNDSLNPRLSRISTESTLSLRTSHDKLQALQKQNAELARKLKESERQLAISGAENDRLVQDLQERLEEAQAEIAHRKKEDKDMKGKDRAQLIAIAGFEADIQSLQRSLENSKANHANMQKMYNSQCDEAQRLRDMLRDRDAEIRDYEESTAAHEADEEKYTREIQALESEIKRLEADLSVARQAESVLDVQKQENLHLKETIDRMKFEMDEAKAAAANNAVSGSGGHLRGGTTTSSGPQTMSRNLGDELSRRLEEAEKAATEVVDGDDGDDGDSVIETIVTTQRTRKVGGRTSSTSGRPIIRVEEGIREYADASTETEVIVSEPPTPVASSSTATKQDSSLPLPPAYTPNPEPIDTQQVLARCHPKESLGSTEAVDEEYHALVEALGLRCQVLEEELNNRRVEREKRGNPRSLSPVSRHSPWSARRRSYIKPGIVNYIFYSSHDGSLLDQVGRFAMWSVVVFSVGLIAGSHLMGPPTGLHPRDHHLWHSMNSLAIASGAGEGFLPVGHHGVLGLMETGARMVAGRVPT